MQLPAHTDIPGKPPQCKAAAFKLIDDELDRVKELITRQLTDGSDLSELRGLLEFFNRRSGKMLRPALVLLCGACCGRITEKHIPVAAIVEMIHNATLLHDDVIDEGQQRRGAPTINSLKGNESAVLLGDFLLSRVFKMCASLQPQVIKIVADTTAQICEGELTQTIQKCNWQLSESQYLDIISKKTAALFGGCCRLGALLAGANDSQIQSLASFGYNTGIAFQLTDDLLDITGDETKLGKTLGTDVDKNKLTLAAIHLLSQLEPEEKNKLIAKLNTAEKTKSLRAEMAERMASYGSLKYTQSLAQKFAGRAIEALADLRQTNAKDVLIETAKFVASRAI